MTMIPSTKIIANIIICAATMSCCLSVNAQNLETKDTAVKSLEQRKMLTREFGLSDQQGILIQKLSYHRSIHIDSLVQLGLPSKEFLYKREQVTDEYYMKIKGILTEEQLKWFDVNALKAARTDEIRTLGLAPRTAIEMGRLKHTFTQNLRQLPENRSERKVRRAELEDKYRNDIYILIGEDKFTAWLNFQDTRLERRYIEKYGFTKEQFRQFQELENRQAVEILKIKNTAMAKERKKARINEVKARKVQGLEKILNAEQFQKWHEDYIRKEINRKH